MLQILAIRGYSLSPSVVPALIAFSKEPLCVKDRHRSLGAITLVLGTVGGSIGN